MNEYEVSNNEQQMHFEVHAEGETAFLEYRWYKNELALMHTIVPDRIGERGIASALAKHALEWAREHNKKVIVYCAFVADYLKKHPEYENLVDKSDR